jgi:hypothetical protein
MELTCETTEAAAADEARFLISDRPSHGLALLPGDLGREGKPLVGVGFRVGVRDAADFCRSLGIGDWDHAIAMPSTFLGHRSRRKRFFCASRLAALLVQASIR